jgi:hypothetical protein
MNKNAWIKAPNLTRTRTLPALGAEILWNSGPEAKAAPAGSPMLYVMARNGSVWNWNGNLAQAIDNNNDCYGLILRFNKFFYYTGGDLITQGEDLIAQKVKAIGLPNPNGGTFAPATKIAAFKCGHHGADTCTSALFLTRAEPVAGIISCGANSYDHPTQSVVDRLMAAATVDYFYLTACPTERTDMPATDEPPGNQYTTEGNKSRVAGWENVATGNIVLTIDTTDSNAITPSFTITYYEHDLPGGAAYNNETSEF